MILKEMEINLFNKLLTLKKEYGCVGIKSEFENEGSDYRDLILLRYLTAKNDLKMIIKIGGVEAFTDLKMAIHLNADGIVVPMVESEFALIKSLNMVSDLFEKDYVGFEVFINIETKTGVQNLESILKYAGNKITGITIGRSDLSYSYDMKSEQDSIFITKKVEEIVESVRNNSNFKITVGGGISKKTCENNYFKDRVVPKIDCIETRNVILKSDSVYIDGALQFALDFEKDYLKYKLMKNQMFIKQDENRFDTLMTRG